jgi:hypothetical protein
LTPADSGNGVIILTAVSIEDTTTVAHETTLSLDVHSNGATGKSAGGVSNTVDCTDSSDYTARAEFARALSASVSI